MLKALATPFVGGVAIQPVFGSGRGHGIDPLDRLTHTGTLARLESQTGGVVAWHDLTALPVLPPALCLGRLPAPGRLGHLALAGRTGRARRTAGLARTRSGQPRQPGGRSRHPGAPAGLMKNSMLDLLSEQATLTHPRTTDLWRTICTQCDLGIGDLVHPRRRPTAGAAAQAAAAPRRAGQEDHGEAVPGHLDDARRATHPVLRPRRNAK